MQRNTGALAMGQGRSPHRGMAVVGVVPAKKMLDYTENLFYDTIVY